MTDPSGPFGLVPQGVRVSVRVTPKASRDKIEGIAADSDGHLALKVSVTTVPEDGKANDAVIKLLSKAWRIPKSTFTVVVGQTSRSKSIQIDGNGTELFDQLTGWMNEAKLNRR
jgi:hypothetical protein